MKILVAVKRVIDYNVRVQLAKDGMGANLAGVKMSINPFDEIALEAALSLKDQGIAQSVQTVTIGPSACEDILRHTLAMGADTSTLIETDDRLFPLDIAKILKALVEKDEPTLVFLGKQAIDDDCNQTGQMLAGLLNWPQATFLSSLKIDGMNATVTRELDTGIEHLTLSLPAVMTADLRLNTPRYATLPNIMKAKQKPLERLPLSALNVTLTPTLKVISCKTPPPPSQGTMVPDVETLVEKLQQEGVL